MAVLKNVIQGKGGRVQKENSSLISIGVRDGILI